MRPLSQFVTLALLLASPAVAAEPAPEVNAPRDGLAVGGYDPVAYFLDGMPMLGTGSYQLHHKGAVWRFVSAESLQAFLDRPAAYTPQFGGYCAWAVSQGYIAPGDPEQWKIVHGKLYLNFNARAKELWEADQAEAIKRGQANWPGVLTKNQDTE